MSTGYSPGHPWYYKQGGEIIDESEIRPKNFSPIGHGRNDPFSIGIVKNKKTLLKKLREARSETKKSLKKDIDRRQEIIDAGPEGFKYLAWDDPKDPMPYYQALALKHNHIVYNKSKLHWINQRIKKISTSPGQMEIF